MDDHKFKLAQLNKKILAMLEFGAQKTSGILLFAARESNKMALEHIRTEVRRVFPVQTRFSRFDLYDGSPDDMRQLVPVALKGDVVDIGIAAASAFDAYQNLGTLGMPLPMLGSESCVAAITFWQPVHLMTSAGQELPNEHPMLQRCYAAFAGAVSGVQTRNANDPGETLWLAEVILLDGAMGELISQGEFRKAKAHWTTSFGQQAEDGLTVREQALNLVRVGKMCPYDYERAFGPIHMDVAMKDGVLQDYELYPLNLHGGAQ